MEQNNTRDFNKDLEESNNIKSEWKRIFHKIFGGDIQIKFQDNKIAQLEFGTDTTIQQKSGRRFSVEYKTKRYELMPYNMWVLEVKHHIYSDKEKTKLIKSKEGWLYCSTAEYVIYGTLNENRNKIIEVCGFSLTPFKNEEFKSNISKLKTGFASTYYPNTRTYQTTVFKLANTEFLREHGDKFWYFKDGGNLNDYF